MFRQWHRQTQAVTRWYYAVKDDTVIVTPLCQLKEILTSLSPKE
jgi:hypothetical protein